MTDKTWDRADFAAKGGWDELDAFLKELEARGPASTPEERERDTAKFLEIHARWHARSLEIFERAKAGEIAPHLSVVNRKRA